MKHSLPQRRITAVRNDVATRLATFSQRSKTRRRVRPERSRTAASHVRLRMSVLATLVLTACCCPRAHAGALNMVFPVHHVAYQHTGTTVTIEALLSGYSTDQWDVNSFVIYTDGTPHDATVTTDDLGFHGTYTLDVSGRANPQEYTCGATAEITHKIYSVTYDFDSTFPDPNPPSGLTGDGHVTHYILSNIIFKGLIWQSTPCKVDMNAEAVLQTDGTYTRVIRPNSDNPYHWQSVPGPGGDTILGPYPAVYLMGATPSLQMDVQTLTGSVPVRTNLILTCYGEGPAYQPFTHTSTLNGSSITPINCPTLSNQVGMDYLDTEWGFDCEFGDHFWSAVYGRVGNEVDDLKLYKVYSTPSWPQSTPWDGVLWNSCNWANGQSTYLNVARYLTTGVYFSQRFAYPADTASNWVAGTTFRLTDFLNTSGYQPGNCVDVSDYLSICAHSQGLSFTAAKYRSDPSNSLGKFDTNPICKIGDDPTDAPDPEMYSPITIWAWHQICLDGNVYDACEAQKYDLSGALYRNPPFNWPVDGFWQTSTPYPDDPVNYCLGMVSQPRPTSPSQFASFTPGVL